MPADASPVSNVPRSGLSPSEVPQLPQCTPSVKRVVQTGLPFSAVELQAMSIDGLLTPVYGSTYLRAGETLSSALRAQAVSRSLPSPLRHRLTIGRLSAAWIYGCAPAPARVSLLTDHQRRTTAVRPRSSIVVHEVDLPASDIKTLGGVAVSTPLRTACDLALYGRREQSGPALAAIGSQATLHCALEDVHAKLELLGRVPRKLAALALVEEIMTSDGYLRRT